MRISSELLTFCTVVRYTVENFGSEIILILKFFDVMRAELRPIQKIRCFVALCIHFPSTILHVLHVFPAKNTDFRRITNN
jgi:hypothetical protein